MGVRHTLKWGPARCKHWDTDDFVESMIHPTSSGGNFRWEGDRCLSAVQGICQRGFINVAMAANCGKLWEQNCKHNAPAPGHPAGQNGGTGPGDNFLSQTFVFELIPLKADRTSEFEMFKATMKCLSAAVQMTELGVYLNLWVNEAIISPQSMRKMSCKLTPVTQAQWQVSACRSMQPVNPFTFVLTLHCLAQSEVELTQDLSTQEQPFVDYLFTDIHPHSESSLYIIMKNLEQF